MKLLKFIVWWLRYLIGLAVVLPVCAVLLVLAGVRGIFEAVAKAADAAVEAISGWDLFPARRGSACKACRGTGRIRAPESDE